MTVTDLRPAPATYLLPVEGASREERRADLIALADLVTLGTTSPPSGRLLSLLVRASAWHGWTPAQAMERWGDYVGEARRRQAVEAGDPFWRDLEPATAAADERAALNDLLDGTTSYSGDRAS